MDYRGVLEPPGKAARGLVEWALDLWPSLNGRALMSGLQLAAMPLSDMLDVIHYVFEEDNMYSSEEQMKSKLKTREVVYRDLYNVDYKYKYKENSSQSGRAYVPTSASQDFDDLPLDEELIDPFKPSEKQPTKPVIPFTPFDPDDAKPFGNILDAPLG